MGKGSIIRKISKSVGGNEVLAFSLTIFGSSMVSALMGSALSFFYTEVLHIAVGVVGTIFLVARIWEAVNDPFMGFVVDRTHTKWGKCIPYLRYAPIPLFIASVFMFLPIQNASSTFKSIYAGAFYILYYMTFTAVDVPISGLSPLLFLDQAERNKSVSISSTIGLSLKSSVFALKQKPRTPIRLLPCSITMFNVVSICDLLLGNTEPIIGKLRFNF